MWNLLVKPIADLFGKGLDLVDKYVEDKDLAIQIKAGLQERFAIIAHTELITLLEGQTKIVLAEVQGESWLQRNWRPVLMLTIVAIVANNYLLYPYLSLFWTQAPVLDLPEHLYSLMKIGVGGYIVGRSAEKAIETWKK